MTQFIEQTRLFMVLIAILEVQTTLKSILDLDTIAMMLLQKQAKEIRLS